MKLEPLNLTEARHALLKQRRPRASATEAGRLDRRTYDWLFRQFSSNQVVGLDQDRIVARSRELATDDTTMAKYLAAIWKNVFGPDGIRLQSKVMLQRGGRPNVVVNRIVEGAWKEWGKKGNCTLDGRLSWIQLQRLVSRVVPVDGEIFIRKVRASGHPFGFALQIINSDRVDRTYGRQAPLVLGNGNLLFMGIETEANTGRVVAYHIFKNHPAEHGSSPQERVRVPASEIIHIFLPTFDNQWRGMPWAMPAMWRMNMLKGYQESELTAARVGASTMGFITKNLDPDPQYPGEGAGLDSNGGQDLAMEPGSFGFLAPGENVAQFSPQHPTTAFPSFVKEAKLDIAAGLDAAYMTLSGDVGSANYSSARVGLLDERATWEGLQGFFIEELCQPIFTAWIEMAFLTFLRSALPGGDWRSYDQAEWHPRAFPWVDPLKDAEAEIAKWSNKMTTLHRILAEQGYDFEETLAEWADEQKYAKSLGVDLTPVAKGGQAVLTENNPSEPKPQAEALVRYVMSATEGK